MDGVKKILEIGAGQGALGTRLAMDYGYTAVEPDPTSFAVADQRLKTAGRGSIHNGRVEELPPDQYDVVCAFEVLEHIEDDTSALQTWFTLIRPGGHLLLSVPAFQDRFSASDERVGHFRRYEPDGLRVLLEKNGFVEPTVRLYGFPLGYALDWARSKIAEREGPNVSKEQGTSESGRFHQPGRFSGWLTFLGALPFRGIQTLPGARNHGTGIVATARRPG
jgi:SAM-dependent methyltransferase